MNVLLLAGVSALLFSFTCGCSSSCTDDACVDGVGFSFDPPIEDDVIHITMIAQGEKFSCEWESQQVNSCHSAVSFSFKGKALSTVSLLDRSPERVFVSIETDGAEPEEYEVSPSYQKEKASKDSCGQCQVASETIKRK